MTTVRVIGKDGKERVLKGDRVLVVVVRGDGEDCDAEITTHGTMDEEELCEVMEKVADGLRKGEAIPEGAVVVRGVH